MQAKKAVGKHSRGVCEGNEEPGQMREITREVHITGWKGCKVRKRLIKCDVCTNNSYVKKWSENPIYGKFLEKTLAKILHEEVT